MLRSRGFLACLVPALSGALPASDEKTSPAVEDPRSSPTAADAGIAAVFSWGDFDGDSKLDLAAVSPDGRLQLLASAGEGSFEDVTERAGLAGVLHASFALWADYDVDGKLDLFVARREGPSLLFHNEGGAFIDMSAGSGLLVEGPVQHAVWIDHDGDGRPDLHVLTAERSALFRGLEGGFFERLEMPLAPLDADHTVGIQAPASPASPGDDFRASPKDESRDETPTSKTSSVLPSPIVVGRRPLPSGPTGTLPIMVTQGCIDSIDDQASSGSCLVASSTPTLGRLYPISTSLFVAVSGNVGIGTTSPAAKLHVAGTARITDTLTLNPAGDQALDLSTGSIYKAGALFLHTHGGTNNTGVGRQALDSVTSGTFDTASGYGALHSNTSGSFNTASGTESLSSNTSGRRNTATGSFALVDNTIGSTNTAHGASALAYNTTGIANTGTGAYALFSNTTGSFNTASGESALFRNTTGLSNTATGNSALYFNSIGSWNTASGVQALYFNTSGSSNTASGNRTLYANATGSLNTAIGAAALTSNTTGVRNTASGCRALERNTIGQYNTGNGVDALRYNTSGSWDTACGSQALLLNTTGAYNTASGTNSLLYNTTGSRNTAAGYASMRQNTTGIYNTANGTNALRANTTGSGNVALGHKAGIALTTGNYNVDIANFGAAGESGTIRVGMAGLQTRAFVAGIRGVTTGAANAIPVLIDSNGQLGTVSSSARFKEEIRDMGELTDRLLALRPVVFRYKPEVQTGERPLEYGLIAEEVAEVFPELVVYDDEGQPFTVKYHLLASMLLNELQKVRERLGTESAIRDRDLEELRERLDAASEAHARELAELRGQLAELRSLQARR